MSAGFWDWGDEFRFSSGLDDPLSGLAVLVEFPVASWVLVWRVEDWVIEEGNVCHSHLMLSSRARSQSALSRAALRCLWRLLDPNSKSKIAFELFTQECLALAESQFGQKVDLLKECVEIVLVSLFP